MKKQSLISLFLATLLLMSGFSLARAQDYPKTSPGTPILFGILDTSRGVLHSLSALFGMVVDPGADLADSVEQYVEKTFGPYDTVFDTLPPPVARAGDLDWDAIAYFAELFSVSGTAPNTVYVHQDILDLALKNAFGNAIANYGEGAIINIFNENFTTNTCGDGILQEPRETCEDGNAIDDGNGCDKNCQWTGATADRCGVVVAGKPPVITPGEACDSNSKYTFCSADGNPGAQLLTCKADCSGFETDPTNGQCTAINGVPEFLGVTIDTYKGDVGYNGANDICKAAALLATDSPDDNAHVCSEAELMSLYAEGKAYDENGILVGLAGLNGHIPSQKGWIVGGRPIAGGLVNPINDCGGFTQTGYFNYGRIWDFAPTVGQAWSRSCNIDDSALELGFACCTY